MKTKYKIGIWGQFGDGGKIADGQAVRTTIITEELKSRYGQENIKVVNTNNWKKHPLDFFKDTVNLNKYCEKIVIFPADNGFKVVVPLLDACNRLYKRELYNVVIGGYLPGLLKSKPKYIGMLRKYRAMFVQTSNLKKDLESLGLNNIRILSNLKRLKSVSKNDIFVNTKPEIKVCTMSRITEDKGILYAVDAVKSANDKLGGTYIKLDIFGIVGKEYEEEFKKILEENRDFVSYGGVVDFDKTTETLKNYFLMIFPTFYYGEGFPGCVIDAYNAALPIIATDWNYNSDVIKDKKNGILVPIKDAKSICNALLNLYNNREIAYGMSLNNIEESKEYKPDKVLKDFYSFMDT